VLDYILEILYLYNCTIKTTGISHLEKIYLLIRSLTFSLSLSFYSLPFLPIPAQQSDKKQRASQCNTQCQCINSITDTLFSTFSSYYVFRSRLETRSEFPFKFLTSSVALTSMFISLKFHSILIHVYIHCFTLLCFLSNMSLFCFFFFFFGAAP
jgi:hypothetical protein